jgi:biopolymer transport protein ExbD
LRLKRRPIEKARIELIPMIDTMAFLRVFFMIASLAMAQQLGLPVDLPRAAAGDPQTWGDRALVVTMERNGRLFLNKQPVRWSQLESAVRARVEARPELVVVINADANLRHGTVMHVMAAVRRAGARQMAVANAPPGEPSEEGP